MADQRVGERDFLGRRMEFDLDAFDAWLVELKLSKVADRLARHYRTRLEYDGQVCDYIAAACLAPDTGARNIDHLLNQQLLPTVSQALLQWQRDTGDAPSVVRLAWNEAEAAPSLVME
ncbi:hypothetical protein ACDA63_09990 [Uliginosibacterium sp. sgz301328]|uniref:hypothetical protein n=1 Tax=Uliginosibacterium sp. sgz301328 TaxID=3243764 RepID=UPI00359DF9F1